MRHYTKGLILALLLGCASISIAWKARGTRVLVRTPAELKAAISKAQPGDTLVMANGKWENAAILFQGHGQANAPIVLTAEEKGKVVLSGQSELSIAGEYLEVHGLHFKNGIAPSKSIVSFRKDAKSVANNCRVTDCVIQDYSNVGEDEKWVNLYGKNNRFDHNLLEGKKSEGTTLVVWLSDTASRENRHRIDHNYFGHRPRLGQNGGETIRIGTSEHSMHTSQTVVEQNYFFRCDGEAEIISIKSAENVIQDNVFYESKGAVVLRHGNNNTIRQNYFIGNNVKETGGIRVINQGHQVYGNHLQELNGSENKSSLVVMNGVVNSPLNGYHQVRDVTVRDNVFLFCSSWQLGVGSRAQQILQPERTLISGNTFYNPRVKAVYEMAHPLPGITFRENRYNIGATTSLEGFKRSSQAYVKGKNGIWKEKGAPDIELPVTPASAGPTWYKQAI
ncbi:polysaccharide lyase 6 family protein [Pontibacter sp. E15-1]|uniref:polysaccharide lyase 6 family protein n=1 Tax=Pontibacter sp. E15-1 TaxID=2919918 RepID=UPI001F4F1FC8|nr:polysaccharide lyase 6 family protein [Pontibacter sp. E15-1]MCJ8163230.1 polysaccharide lyase 6 family protein [Pontibacter sp. E15-1]